MSSKKTSIAIVGAGFAGLALGFHLLNLSSDVSVTIFDQKGIGAGASGVASGLLHPFPASASKLSFKASQAMHESLLLLKETQKVSSSPISNQDGILKIASTQEQKIEYPKIARRYENLSYLQSEGVRGYAQLKTPSPALYIEGGVTVFCKAYLDALWALNQKKNALFIQRKIEKFDELKEFDQVIFCAGSGIKELNLPGKFQFVKGQILTGKSRCSLTTKSLIASGYITLTSDPNIFHVGSTYEHHYSSEKSDQEIAKKILYKQWRPYFDLENQIEILSVDAGIRVMNPMNYLPYIKKYSDSTFAILALGSRGLLYHALLAKHLALHLITKKSTDIFSDFLV